MKASGNWGGKSGWRNRKEQEKLEVSPPGGGGEAESTPPSRMGFGGVRLHSSPHLLVNTPWVRLGVKAPAGRDPKQGLAWEGTERVEISWGLAMFIPVELHELVSGGQELHKSVFKTISGHFVLERKDKASITFFTC